MTFTNITATANSDNGIEFNYDTDGAHTLDTVTVNSSGSGIVAARGLASVKSANITADDIGIAMGNKYGGSFQDLVISAKNEGLMINNSDGVSNGYSFANIKATSKNRPAIRVTRSGLLTFSKITATSNNDNVIQLDFGADGAHTFDDITLTNTGGNGKGLSSITGLSSVKNATVASQGIALDIGNKYSMTLDGVLAKSTQSEAIYLRNSGNSPLNYTLKNITISGTGGWNGDGLVVEQSNLVSAENICVLSLIHI